MRITSSVERCGVLVRVFSGRYHHEVAYVSLGLSGLQAEIELPTEWHDHKRAWVRIGLGLIKVAFSFPWRRVAPDYHQCAGPTYGFSFFEDMLFVHYGQSKGVRADPYRAFRMPWSWRHVDAEHKVLTKPETHDYFYRLRDGYSQHRRATIHVETRTWVRPWFPWRRTRNTIEVRFDLEVGEKSGSWKGGCLGCEYEMKPGETPVQTLRRMERERFF